jgi:chorismate mutase / prephenate dehydratase
MDSENLKGRLAAIREEVDKIDALLVELLNKRAGKSVEIGKLKKEIGLKLHSPEREKMILENITDTDHEFISRESLKRYSV